MKLFRQQAIDAQSCRLHGEILVLPRVSQVLLAVALLLWLLLLGLFLLQASYTRKETVRGWLEPADGVLRVYPATDGKVGRLLVSEGELVQQGQALAVMNGDRILADGQHLETILLQEYDTQKASLLRQLEQHKSLQKQKSAELLQRIQAAQGEISWIDKQLHTLQQRHALMGQRLERQRLLQSQGVISTAQLETVQEQALELTSRQQSLLRSRLQQHAVREQLVAAQAMLGEQSANNTEHINISLSNLSQQIARARGNRAYLLKASRAGRVSHIGVSEGQYAKLNVPLMSLVSEQPQLRARLLVPVRAAGFVAAGQPLLIRYDAFPYQKFGSYRGTIVSVSESLVLPGESTAAPLEPAEPGYRVTADLQAPYAQAYGRKIALKPGMTLAADIQLERRSLLQWLLEPILSLRGRW